MRRQTPEERVAREARLPQWAQQELSRLRADLARAKAALSAGPENSNVFADPYIENRPLGQDTRIEFHVGGAKISVHIDGDMLQVGSNSDRLSVEPRASNSFYVRPTRR